jgi:hypothetical protein
MKFEIKRGTLINWSLIKKVGVASCSRVRHFKKCFPEGSKFNKTSVRKWIKSWQGTQKYTEASGAWEAVIGLKWFLISNDADNSITKKLDDLAYTIYLTTASCEPQYLTNRIAEILEWK